jgi:hypothetical protein
VLFVTNGQAFLSEKFLWEFRAAKAHEGFAFGPHLWTPLPLPASSSPITGRLKGLDDRAALEMAFAVSLW